MVSNSIQTLERLEVRRTEDALSISDTLCRMPTFPRTVYAAAAIFMQILLGIIYAWSVFRGPLAALHGWSKAETIAPYRYSMLSFAAGMIIAGFWQDRKGPRVVATVGGLLIAVGFFVAAQFGDSLNGLILGYGLIAGLGVGFAYVTPIATCVKWFPDRRGMIVGLAVMGFGVGPLLFGPLVERLLGKDPNLFVETIPRTLWILGTIFLFGVTGAAQIYRVPPVGWKPGNWQPSAASATVEFSPAQALRTWQFYAVWLLYFLGSAVGLTVIGEASPMLTEMSKSGAWMSAGAALGVMSIFNGGGRLLWGTISDRLGRKWAAAAICLISALACIGFLRTATSFGPLLAGLCLAAFCYGGQLALMPSFMADFYGPKNVGANYGLLFSAWGLCGFLVPGYFAKIMDRARVAQNLAAGYSEVYQTLAVISLIGILVALILRRPNPIPEKA
jgi:MFS transporter, OFA family, oxalate/formate antiporter